MEWYLALLLILGSALFMLALGLPVAFAFLFIIPVGAFLFWGGTVGLEQIGVSMFGSLATFSLFPIPMFVLLGEILFLSGMVTRMLDTLGKWMGRVPGRLSLLTVAGATLFGALSGSSIAATAVLGSVLLPEMEKRNYKKPMSIGPIIGCAGLDIIIPPSNLAVILGSIAEISIGKLLISGYIPGLIMAASFAIYIIVRCWLQPHLAPPYDVGRTSLSEKFVDTLRYVLPLGFIIFLVMGLIFLGVATPSESAALGALGAVILAAVYRKLTWQAFKQALVSTALITIMTFMIVMAATVFSQILVISGATRGIIGIMSHLPLVPIVVVIIMQLILIVMGMFISSIAMVMITVPIYFPIIRALGLDPLWFGLLTLINMEMAQTTPPFGMILFIMQGLAPPGTTFGDIARAGIPFLICTAGVMALVMAFPVLALWLPNLMH